MLLRTSLSAAGALLLASGAYAQTNLAVQPQAAPTAKDAGVYHMATGTWTRASSPIAMIGVDTLYDNTCVTGTYGGMNATQVFVDAGRLPSTTSPVSTTSLAGSANSYLVNGFQMAYCTGEVAVDVNVNFYQCYDLCSDATVLVPDQTFGFVGLPGVGTGTGALACWFITIDLDLTTAGFNMQADCDGTYDATPALDTFGYSFEIAGPYLSGTPQGPIFAGDPFGIVSGTACPYGDGTFWSGNTNTGTGIGSSDAWEADLGGVYQACFFFGGYLSGAPYSSMVLQLIGDATAGPVITGTEYCFGTAGSACPCGNFNDGSNGNAGCANSVLAWGAGGASLTGAGTPSVTGDTVVLTSTGVQANQPGIFFRADNATNGGAGIAFGDGLRCAGGNVVRFPVVVATAGGVVTSTAALGAGLTASDIRRYQYWYRNPFLGGACGGNNFNLSSGFEITWGA